MKDSQSFGYTTASTTTMPTTASILATMRELSAKYKDYPNAIVTTTKELAKIRAATETRDEVGTPDGLSPLPAFGTPIEDYATVRECLDRMMTPREGERLQLVLSESIPVDCFDHSYMRRSLLNGFRSDMIARY